MTIDEKAISDVVSGVIQTHIKTNGDKVQKSIWVRFVIQLLVITVVVVSAYFNLYGQITTNAAGVASNSKAIELECARSKLIDTQINTGINDIKLKINTIEIQQSTVMNEQIKISKDVEKIDEKLDGILKRLPK